MSWNHSRRYKVYFRTPLQAIGEGSFVTIDANSEEEAFDLYKGQFPSNSILEVKPTYALSEITIGTCRDSVDSDWKYFNSRGQEVYKK